MTHNVLIPAQIAAMNIDSLNRSVIDAGVSASAIDNGWVLQMGAQYTTGSWIEVFEVSQPSSASPAGLWMAYSGDEIVVTDAKYKGLDPDPRNFSNAANKVFSAYKPQVGDIIVMTADGFSNSFSSHAYAASQLDSFKLVWTTQTSGSYGGLTYKYIATTYISLATGAIDNQRVTAYKLECVQI
jgi:hypothetical protein